MNAGLVLAIPLVLASLSACSHENHFCTYQKKEIARRTAEVEQSRGQDKLLAEQRLDRYIINNQLGCTTAQQRESARSDLRRIGGQPFQGDGR